MAIASSYEIAQLVRMPAIGSPYPVAKPQQGLRKWPVKGFRRYLIFYFNKDDAIEVVRILHVTQDISSILEDEP